MNVDLPAPLSPSTHVTWPALDQAGDVLERDHVAEVLGDVADLEQRRLAVGLAHRRAPSALLRTRLLTSTAISRITPRNRNRQSVFQPAELDPDEGHADDQRAERRADRRAVAAGQQAAADDRGDDVGELLADALAGLHRAQPQRDHDPDERRGAAR